MRKNFNFIPNAEAGTISIWQNENNQWEFKGVANPIEYPILFALATQRMNAISISYGWNDPQKQEKLTKSERQSKLNVTITHWKMIGREINRKRLAKEMGVSESTIRNDLRELRTKLRDLKK